MQTELSEVLDKETSEVGNKIKVVFSIKNCDAKIYYKSFFNKRYYAV